MEKLTPNEKYLLDRALEYHGKYLYTLGILATYVILSGAYFYITR